MTTLLIEPFGGMAGDMLLAALCDLGDPRFGLCDLERLAADLNVGEVQLTLSEVHRGSMRGLQLCVRTPESDSTPHRHLSDLLALLERAPLSADSRRRAASVFRRIARAEAQVHGVAEESIHFHEIGAVDTLIDVCGAVLALERLAPARILATAPLVGDGSVRCAHGEMPVPAPATAELLVGVPVRYGGGGERLTPTGAALLTEFSEFSEFAGAGDMNVRSIGYGAGTRDPKEGPPNLVRVQLAESAGGEDGGRAGDNEVHEFAFQVDDSTGEEVGFCLEQLRALPVLDVWHTPILMKKGRPGLLVSGLVRPGRRAEVERVVFDQTSTFGVRWSAWSRTECRRSELGIEIDGHVVRVKRRYRPHVDDVVSAADFAPEYEDLRALSESSGVPLRQLAQRVVAQALREASTAT